MKITIIPVVALAAVFLSANSIFASPMNNTHNYSSALRQMYGMAGMNVNNIMNGHKGSVTMSGSMMDAKVKKQHKAAMATRMRGSENPTAMTNHKQMMADMTAMNTRLDILVAKMNASKGSHKVDATAAVVNELVAQRKTMQKQMGMMRDNMTQNVTVSHRMMDKDQAKKSL